MKTEEEIPESEFDPDCIIQEKSNEDLENPYRNKPKLKAEIEKLQKKNRTLEEYPMEEKGQDISGLCSIMWCIFQVSQIVITFFLKRTLKMKKKLKISKNSKKNMCFSSTFSFYLTIAFFFSSVYIKENKKEKVEYEK